MSNIFDNYVDNTAQAIADEIHDYLGLPDKVRCTMCGGTMIVGYPISEETACPNCEKP